jgi:hypothetical protein
VLFLRCVYLARVHIRRAGRDVDPMISKALESGYSVSVLSLIREQEKKAHCTLHNLLRSTVKFLASDRRDKVYALLGLLDKRGAAYGITTEYGPSATVRDVFIAATKAIMLVDHVWPFRLLGSVEARTDMPSWVPTFTSDCNSGLIQQPYSPRAGGLGLPKSELLNNDRVLRVTGIEVAYIDDGICPQYVGGRICQTLKAWTTFALQRLSEAGSLTPPSIQNFLTTIIGGSNDGFHDSEPPALQDDMRGLVKSIVDILSKKWHTNTRVVEGCSFFALADGTMGLVPGHVRPGDLIFVPCGADAPIVVRKTGTKGQFIVFEECYVHGIMNGELFERPPSEVEVKKIDLV